MAVADAQAFVNKFFTDADFQKAVTDADTPEAKYEVVKAAGFEFSKDDALELLPEGVSLEDLQNLDPDSEELPDEILEAVAGGKGGGSWDTIPNPGDPIGPTIPGIPKPDIITTVSSPAAV